MADGSRPGIPTRLIENQSVSIEKTDRGGLGRKCVVSYKMADVRRFVRELPIQATLTTVVHFRLGENDPGATSNHFGGESDLSMPMAIPWSGMVRPSTFSSRRFPTAPWPWILLPTMPTTSRASSIVFGPATISFSKPGFVSVEPSPPYQVIAYFGHSFRNGYGLMVHDGQLGRRFRRDRIPHPPA